MKSSEMPILPTLNQGVQGSNPCGCTIENQGVREI